MRGSVKVVIIGGGLEVPEALKTQKGWMCKGELSNTEGLKNWFFSSKPHYIFSSPLPPNSASQRTVVRALTGNIPNATPLYPFAKLCVLKYLI